MVRRHLSGSVELRDITDARGLSDLETLHLSETTVRVQDIALITDIEEITAVGPDTVIVLSDRAAMGSWMLSAALRYAWERRASALIVPEVSATATAVELARRLEVSLLTTRRDPTRLALDVALQIGVARAGMIARVQAFSERVSRAESFTEAMSMVSDELGGAAARIETSGAVTIDIAESDDALREEGGQSRERVAVPIYPNREVPDFVVAHVQEYERDYAEQVLQVAAPTVRALLNESRLQAIRDSLPPISITALAGETKGESIDEPPQSEFAVLDQWPFNGPYLAVCILTTHRERLGAAVHQVWQKIFAESPLARIDDGWLGFVPIPDIDAHRRITREVRERFDEVRALQLRVGLSRAQSSRRESVTAVREAWFAARLARHRTQRDDASESGILEFGEVSLQLLARLLPEDLAEQLTRALMPKLLDDPASDEVIEAVVAYLSCRGSAQGAARELGVHRNTVQARLRRAEELDVPLAEPEKLLSTHMLLTTLLALKRMTVQN